MKKHILVNIGNRNIKVKRNEYKDGFIPSKDFRNETKRLLENFEKEKFNIELNILPPILEAFSASNIYLFCTNQDNENNKQDTLFESEIIKKIIENKYPESSIYIEEQKFNPTNEDELIDFYTHFVKRHSFYEKDVVYYDSGGTPQQKNSLRSVLEFYLPPENLIQFYGANINGKTELKELKRTKSEELRLKRQVKSLLNSFNYSASFQLAKELNLNKPFIQANDMASLLWNGLINTFYKKHQLNQLNKAIKSNSNFQEIEPLYRLNNNINYYKCYLLLCKFHAQRETYDYTGSVLSLQQIIETYVLGKLSEHVSIDLSKSKKYYKDQGTVQKEILDQYGPEIENEYGRTITSLSLPVQLIFLSIHNKVNLVDKELINQIKNIISSFKDSELPNNQRLDVYRNAIAHKGSGISEDIFSNEVYESFLNKLDTFFGYSSTKNIYLNLNKLLISFL